jgi:hypothetical protein
LRIAWNGRMDGAESAFSIDLATRCPAQMDG